MKGPSERVLSVQVGVKVWSSITEEKERRKYDQRGLKHEELPNGAQRDKISKTSKNKIPNGPCSLLYRTSLK